MGVEDLLYERQSKALNELRGLRKPVVEDIFKRIAYISPEDIEITGYKRKRPLAVFNPGAILEGRTLTILPRIIFDYYKYVSSIGLVKLDIEELLEGKVETPIKARIITWPQHIWEFLGCEDPRVYKDGDKYYVLYTGKGYLVEDNKYVRKDFLSFAQFDSSWRIIRKGHFSIAGKGETFIPRSNKDSAFIRRDGNEYVLLTRPEIRQERLGWACRANLDELKIYDDSLKPILVYEEWEFKVGWSTNVVKLSSNEYLVGWHGVIIEDNSYRNGMALIDCEGELLAISNYLLSPNGIVEEYGDRPLVIFGDGLVKYKEYLLWIGGVSDYAIGVFGAEIDNIFEKLIYIK